MGGRRTRSSRVRIRLPPAHWHLESARLPLLVTLKRYPEEPAAGPWRVERIADLFAGFADLAEMAAERPLVVAIDGRSSSGKTTVAGRIADAIPATAVVHTDDIAWFHSRFGWADLAVRVLEAARAGEPLSFRPPAWDKRGREGAIVLPRDIRLLLLEGVGSSREELSHLLDRRLWVQADRAATDRRDDDRVVAGEVTRSTLEAWMAEELSFVAARRPWEHADLVLAGTPTLPHDPRMEVIVADGPLPSLTHGRRFRGRLRHRTQA